MDLLVSQRDNNDDHLCPYGRWMLVGGCWRLLLLLLLLSLLLLLDLSPQLAAACFCLQVSERVSSSLLLVSVILALVATSSPEMLALHYR